MNGVMKKFPVVVGVLGLALALSSQLSQAAVITQWTFSGNTSTAASNANTPAPTTGSGYATQLGMTNPYNGGSIAACNFLQTNGTADPSYGEYLWRVRATTSFADGTPNNLPNGAPSANGWALYNISSPTAHDGAPEYTQGCELDTSTVGYSNISFSFDWYCTTQGVRDMQFQYNLNTSNASGWTNIGAAIGGPAGGVPDGPGSQNYVFIATPNDFYGGANPQTITVNLSSITGANNDPKLGIRMVSAFDDTGRYQDYVAATLNGGLTQLYNNSSGNWRFGNLTFQGALTLNTTPTGPALTWNTGSGAWNTIASNQVWLNSSSAPAAYTDGSSVTFGNVSSGISTIAVAGSGVAPASVAINDTVSGTGYAYSGGAISGTGALYLQPTNVGSVSLSGSNTYTGGTQVSGGTLIVASDSSLGVSSGAGGAVVLDNGSTLQLASSFASGRLFEIGSNGGVLNTQSFSFSTSGSFIAGGAFTELGSGSLTLNGAVVQLSGSTSLAAGNLVLSGTNGASLQGGATLNGNLVINGAERVNFDSVGSAGLYGGAGQIQVPYHGSITSSFTSSSWPVLSNTPTGSVTAVGGTVTSGGTISNNVVLNSSNLPFTKTNVAATLAPSGSNAFIVGIGATTPGNTLAFTGNISGNSDVVLGSNTVVGAGGAGTLFLSGSNSYAGATLIAGNGVVQLGSTAALPPTTDVIFGVTDASTATLDLNGFNQTINSLSTSGGTSGTSTITNSSLTTSATLSIAGGITPKYAYNGSITGNLALDKAGAGALTLTGSSTYSGATTIANGTLTVANTSALGVGPLSLLGGASLVYSGSAVSLANSSASMVSGVSVSSGGTAAFGTLALNSLNLSGGSLTYDFNTTQSDLITGAGALNLSLASSTSPIVINLNTSGQTFNSYPLFQFGSVSNFNSADFTIGSGTKAGYTYGFQQNAGNSGEIDLTITGTGSNNLPTRQSLTWAVGSGTWNTAAANWGGAATYVDGDTVTFGEPTANNSVVTISGTGAGGAVTPLAMTISNSSNSYSFTGGPITGTTALYKINNGMATLSTSNSYTGGTFITGGTLATGAAGNAALGAASGGVTLDTQGTLMITTSNFSSSRSITVNPGGGTIFAIGSGGTSSVTSGNLSIAGNAIFNYTGTGSFEVSGNVTAGTGSLMSVQAGTLSVVPENLTANGQLNIASGATLLLLTKTASTANSKSVALGNDQTTINGNLVITNPLTVQFNGNAAINGTGAIQFQNMGTTPAPTHFTNSNAQSITVTGNYITQNINVGIQLNSANLPFYKTSISQSGSTTNGTGFILGNGTACSFFALYPGTGNTINMNGAISGSCDVQFGEVGGGGGGNINLNAQSTYTGVTMFEFGVPGNVTLGVANALPTTTDLLFAPINGNSYQDKLDLNGNNQTVASLSYWASANDAGPNTSNGMQVVNGNPNAVATLTVSGALTPSRAYGGLLGDTGNGNLILVKDGPNTLWLSNNDNSYTGGTTVKNGLLLLSPSNPMSGTPTGPYEGFAGSGDVTVSGGTLQGTATIQGNLNVGAAGTVHPGLANSLVVGGQPGTLAVDLSATVSGGANMQYDVGTTSSSLLNVNGALTLTGTGIKVNLIDDGGLTGAVPLITYGSLNTFSASQFVIGSSPQAAGRYTFSNSGNTIYVVAPGPITWVGSPTKVWDTGTTVNFYDPTIPGDRVFNTYDHVVFDDSGSGGTVSIAAAGVAPGGVVFQNSAKSYTITGGPITDGPGGGHASLTVAGGGLVTLANSNTYSGATTVTAGTLTSVNALGALTTNGTNQTLPTAAFANTTVSGAGACLSAPQIYQNALNISNGGSVTLTGSTFITPGSQLSAVSSLNISGTTGAWTGKLDVGQSGILVPSSGGAATIFNQIAQGCNTDVNEMPHWNGTGGITSSAAAQNPTSYAVGYKDLGNGQIKLAYTIAGDALLLGALNSQDVQTVSGSNLFTSGAGWSGGDFNYDGVTDNADRNILLNNYYGGTVLPSLKGQAKPLGAGVQPAGQPAANMPQIEYNPNNGALTLDNSGPYTDTSLQNLDNFTIHMPSTGGANLVTLYAADGTAWLNHVYPTSLQWAQPTAGGSDFLSAEVYNLGSLPPGLTSAAFGNVVFADSYGDQQTVSGGVEVVPEPSSLALCAAAGLALAVGAWRRRRNGTTGSENAAL